MIAELGDRWMDRVEDDVQRVQTFVLATACHWYSGIIINPA